MFKDVQGHRSLSLSVLLALVCILLLAPSALAASNTERHFHALVGPKAHYLALGDSLAFGYQPNKDYTHGYVPDYFQTLKDDGVKDVTDYGCPGETSTTMVKGGCPAAPQGTPAQLLAALAFLQQHAGTVSPVTLDIGANDVLPDSNSATCTIDKSKFESDLATFDANFKGVILPQLHDALMVHDRLSGDLVVMNYYFPYQNICPNLLPYNQIFNQHIADDAKGLATLVNVFRAFGSSKVPNPNLCTYTWICSEYHDIHATVKGYSVIADAFEDATY